MRMGQRGMEAQLWQLVCRRIVADRAAAYYYVVAIILLCYITTLYYYVVVIILLPYYCILVIMLHISYDNKLSQKNKRVTIIC